MRGGRDELAGRLRDEAYHLRVVTRELRNRAQNLARSYDEACTRIDELIAELEAEGTSTSREAHGDRHHEDTKTLA